MKEQRASRTAERVAYERAAHQILDNPRVFEDPLAFRILGVDARSAREADPEVFDGSTYSNRTRAYIAVRSRFAEDELSKAVRGGVKQYVVLGAGLDTFAFRNPYTESNLVVFEIDHPATQAWKRGLLEKAGIAIPGSVTFVPLDFETKTLEEGLKQAGFRDTESAFFSWLGVASYLPHSAVVTTLRFVASMPSGSGIVFDYMVQPLSLKPVEQQAFARLEIQVNSEGEPFRNYLDPLVIAKDLENAGFTDVKDLESREINDRYFKDRTDGLRSTRLTRIVSAWV